MVLKIYSVKHLESIYDLKICYFFKYFVVKF